LQTICLGWLQTEVLLISVSWVARITGVSHWHPAQITFVSYFTTKMKSNQKELCLIIISSAIK
jgi:hypothetical protein